MTDQSEAKLLFKRYKEIRERLRGPEPSKLPPEPQPKRAPTSPETPERAKERRRVRTFRTFQERVNYWRGKPE